MRRKDFIVKVLRIITMAIDNDYKLEDIIVDIERLIETRNMIRG